jgi:hypothetical protein
LVATGKVVLTLTDFTSYVRTLVVVPHNHLTSFPVLRKKRMSTSHGLDSFRQHYGTWLTAVAPLLEAGEFKQNFAPSLCVRCSNAPWTPLRRPVAASTVALVSTGGFYHHRLQAPCGAVHIDGDTSFDPRAAIPGELYSLSSTWDGEIAYQRET